MLFRSFTVADATNGLQGQGPSVTGEPAFLNLVFASRNPANLDAIFCAATMLEMPNYVSMCGNNINAKNVELVGSDLDALKYPINPAMPHETPHPDIKLIGGKACPACLNLMNNLTSGLIGTRGQQTTIVMGSMLTKNMLKGERLIILGDCAIKKLEYLDIKSPAKIDEKIDFIEQFVLLKKLLTTEGTPKITHVDKVKSKIKKLLSKVS